MKLSLIKILKEQRANDKLKDTVKGGLADKANPSQFDQKQLMKGMHVEFEHTSDILQAMEIAMDHLIEDPDYYGKLAAIHSEE